MFHWYGRSYGVKSKHFSAWWVTTILYNYGTTFRALRAPLSQSLPNILDERGVQRLQEPPPYPTTPLYPLRTASLVSHTSSSWRLSKSTLNRELILQEFDTHYFPNGVFCSIVPLPFLKPMSPQWPASELLCKRLGWRAKLYVSSSTVSHVFTNWPSKRDSKVTFWVLALR